MLAIFSVLLPQQHAAAAIVLPSDSSSAAIYSYQRIGEDNFPQTNIQKAQFEEHMHEIQREKYTVTSLPDIITAFERAERLPDFTIAITFDGGYRSILNNAVPFLIEHKIPFTWFIPTDQIDGATPQYIGWNDIKKLRKYSFVTIGIMPASYVRLYGDEKSKILQNINKARSRFREEIGSVPDLFAYPFGEYDLAYKDIIKSQEFRSAFSLHSGIAYANGDVYDIPRFPMTESYGDIDRFRLTANALPLPIENISPEDNMLTDAQPNIGFTVPQDLADNIDSISCFASGMGRVEHQRVGPRIELRLPEPFTMSRNRINCTMPNNDIDDTQNERWRWFGRLYVLKQQDNATDQNTTDQSDDIEQDDSMQATRALVQPE